MNMRASSQCVGLIFGFWTAAAVSGGCSPKSATIVLPDVPPVPMDKLCASPADAQVLARGKMVYVRVCASCHQVNGRGLPGIFPPLAEHAARLGQNPEGRAYLTHLVLWGLSGPITVGGKIYQNVMPPQASLLNDQDVADVLSYVLYSFDNCRAFASMPSFDAGNVHKRRQTSASGLETFQLRRTTVFTPPA